MSRLPRSFIVSSQLEICENVNIILYNDKIDGVMTLDCNNEPIAVNLLETEISVLWHDFIGN